LFAFGQQVCFLGLELSKFVCVGFPAQSRFRVLESAAAQRLDSGSAESIAPESAITSLAGFAVSLPESNGLIGRFAHNSQARVQGVYLLGRAVYLNIPSCVFLSSSTCRRRNNRNFCN